MIEPSKIPDAMTDYQRTLRWLYSLEAAKGMDFKLERVALALRRLGDPHRAFRSIHVAGTNGKGSVCAMLHSILDAGGYRVGLYTSPHLVRFTERFRVGAAEISEARVVELTAEIQRAASGIELTFFELVTVMAFVHFARASVDVAVVEAGLGGRLDATNVIEPLASVITSIGIDHTQYLGRTLTQIAAEKGGIIKPGRPVVLGRMSGRAGSTLRRIARERQAHVVDASSLLDVAPNGTLTFHGDGADLSQLRLPLAGEHQQDNASTALAALDVLRRDLPISEPAVRDGLARCRWPGRLEIVGRNPLTILDGAHNPDGVAALVRSLRALLGGRELHVLFAVMRDKRWRTMIDKLAPLCTSATTTEVQMPRGLPATVAARRFARYCPSTAIANPHLAWEHVRGRAAAHQAILVAGSLFLIGALHETVSGGAHAGSGPVARV